MEGWAGTSEAPPASFHLREDPLLRFIEADFLPSQP
jgi:hypothetical protein